MRIKILLTSVSCFQLHKTFIQLTILYEWLRVDVTILKNRENQDYNYRINKKSEIKKYTSLSLYIFIYVFSVNKETILLSAYHVVSRYHVKGFVVSVQPSQESFKFDTINITSIVGMMKLRLHH